MPAVAVLERFLVPAIALTADGAVLFVNTAFAAMLGRSRDEVASLRYEGIFHFPRAEEPSVVLTRLHPDTMVELLHADGSTVFAKMAEPITMVCRATAVVVATFEDLTERLWMHGTHWDSNPDTPQIGLPAFDSQFQSY